MTTLKALREENKCTVADVAKVLGVANSTYYNYEQGIRRLGLEYILLLSSYYDCSAEEIITAQLNSCQKVR